MAQDQQRVVFARINRRRNNQPVLTDRTFPQDMQVLAASHLTRYFEPGTSDRPDRTWIAADLELTPHEDFMTGTLGFSERREERAFDEDAWSWLKGPTEERESGSDHTVVPFVVDLSAEGRWVAFATAQRMQPPTFRRGLELVLRQAVADAGILGGDWDVDLITSRTQVEQWLAVHPDVYEITRTIKFSNPGDDIDDDRNEMRALAANRKTETFRAHYGQVLDVQSERFQGKIDGTATGDLELHMRARGRHGHKPQFKSEESPDHTFIEPFLNLEGGLASLLEAIRAYKAQRAGPTRQ